MYVPVTVRSSMGRNTVMTRRMTGIIWKPVLPRRDLCWDFGSVCRTVFKSDRKMERNKRNKKYRIKQLVGWMIYAVWIVAVLSCAYRMTDEDWEKNGKVRLLLRRPDSGCPENTTWYFYPEGLDSPIIRTGDVSGV